MLYHWLGDALPGESSPDRLPEAQVSIVSISDCGAAYGVGMVTGDTLRAQAVNAAGQVTDAAKATAGGLSSARLVAQLSFSTKPRRGATGALRRSTQEFGLVSVRHAVGSTS